MNRRLFLAALGVGCIALPALSNAAQGSYRLLTYPGTGKANIAAARFVSGVKPLQKILEQELGAPLFVKLIRELDAFNAGAEAGAEAPDMVYGPASSAAHYIAAGYLPLVRVASLASGMIVSKKSLAEIRTLSLPDAQSWLGEVGLFSIEEHTGRSFSCIYARSQEAAAFAVQIGLADAVAVRPGTFQKMKAQAPEFRAILQLPETPDFTFLVHPRRVTGEDQARLLAALTHLPESTLRELDQVYHVKVGRFVATQTDEYAPLLHIVAARRGKRAG